MMKVEILIKVRTIVRIESHKNLCNAKLTKSSKLDADLLYSIVKSFKYILLNLLFSKLKNLINLKSFKDQ